MLGWSIWFLARFDSAFAHQQYRRYLAVGSTNLGVLRPCREWPGRYATGAGDVDSGPLILGYGIPATVFACADAVPCTTAATPSAYAASSAWAAAKLWPTTSCATACGLSN